MKHNSPTLQSTFQKLTPPVPCFLSMLAALITSVAFPSGAAQMTPIFGPTQYTRIAGPPATFTGTFSHCGTAPCQLVVINGNSDGSKRVSSASISLNGVQILRPSDLNQHVARIVKPVSLRDINHLAVTLASKPGSFLLVDVESLTSPVVLSAGGPGVSLLNPTTLLSALPILNNGSTPAENVQVTAITLAGGTLTVPTSLPLSLGTIPAGGSAVLDADFSGGPFVPRASYALTVEGTYSAAAATYCFTLNSELIIPPAAPGSAALGRVTARPNHISGAPFPAQPPGFGPDDNLPFWTIPIGPFVPGTPTPTSTGTQMPAKRAPSAVIFPENNSLGVSAGTIAEPSGGANGGGVIFATANWLAAYSTDGGSTFTQLDPTTIFPNDAVGFCCDQIVQYVPSVDRFIWLLQGNGVRIASASPADITSSGGTAWTYWNLTPQLFGQPVGTGFDYPDLSVGDNDLYMSWDAGFGCPAGCRSGFQVARTSLAGLQAGGTITIEFTDPPDAPMAWGSHLMQDTADEIFWAGHNNNSQMRVFSLAEGSGTYFWRDVGISTWANNALVSTTPDGQNWLSECGGGFPGSSIIGATRSANQLWFAWAAATNSFFHQPHVEMVTLNRANNFSVIQQVQIWNNDYAFAYPALATCPCTGEVGLSLEYGGNGNYENHVVGFWGDFVVYITTASDVGTCRFGDYVTIRQQPPTDTNPGNLFSAFGYGLNSGPGAQVDVRYVLFGRPATSCSTNPPLKTVSQHVPRRH